jgi:glutathione S-transferase
MKLYSVQPSNNCRRVNATIAHLGLKVEVIEPNMMQGDLKKPDYLGLNPNAKVPTLVDGDFKLWESRAIMQYLAAKNQPNELWPADPRHQADILRWQFWEASHLSRGTTPFAFEKLFKPMFMKLEPDAAALAAGEKEFHMYAPVLEAQLKGKPFILGDKLTLADFSVGGCFSFAEPSGLPWGDYTHIRAWWARLNEVHAWKSTAPKFG